MQESRDIDLMQQLEARLKRVEYVVAGHQSLTSTQSRSTTAIQRLQELQRALDHLIAKSTATQQLLSLYSEYPQLFNTSLELDTSDQATAIKLPVVLAAATSYPQTASSLTSVMDMPIPSTQNSRRILSTLPQLRRLEALQESQIQQISQLKERTALVLQRWYATDMIRAGEYWVDVDERVNIVERQLRRAAVLKEQAEAVI